MQLHRAPSDCRTYLTNPQQQMPKKKKSMCVTIAQDTTSISTSSLCREKFQESPSATPQSPSNYAVDASSATTWAQSPFSLRAKTTPPASSSTSDQKTSGRFPLPSISKKPPLLAIAPSPPGQGSPVHHNGISTEHRSEDGQM
ncbi:hypothetical protein DID88_004283 [Monilinia fructigena]|uniref:Uncharacterized protein n=1 Tax=Monilinia fructigena TaxID=38457 RepID=A0A395ITL7_9HELO|nr:hypothetical protein DID88_004283 [Monilinia fructigena]